jgi:hypothetical protein
VHIPYLVGGWVGMWLKLKALKVKLPKVGIMLKWVTFLALEL